MQIIFDSSSAISTAKVQGTKSILAKLQPVAHKTALYAILLASSVAVFLLGANYYPLYPTNGNVIYAACISAAFLSAAIIFKRSKTLSKYWGIAYAFFIAAMVNLISILFGGYYTDFVQLFGVATDPNRIDGLAKLYDTLLVVIPILVLTLASGADLSSLFLKVGNQYRKWGFGIGALVMVNFFTSVLIFFGSGFELPKLGSAILWGLVFSLSNSLLEELWIRGLFLKKFVPLLGGAGAVIVTSIAFGMMHFLGVAYLPATVVPIFVANTFTMGLACGILMLKTDSIWGAYLIHAAADLFLFIATIAAH
jgi:membrane protease YdiL (CAAX protease family)